jgi:transcriptional regulator with XRE-family HTH domain
MLSHEEFLEKLKKKAIQHPLVKTGKDDRGIQTGIARALNIGQARVCGWFSGSFPRADYLVKICEVFGISPNELLGVEESKTEEPPSQINVADLVSIVEAGIETEDFLSVPIQTFGSTIQAGGQFLGQVVIHKRVFGRRKNLAAVQLNGGKEIKVVIVGK